MTQIDILSFKPYYKWITFNTYGVEHKTQNLYQCFKPYYKWITFNTMILYFSLAERSVKVLNLIINGLPSIQCRRSLLLHSVFSVLNLIINGLPSILVMLKSNFGNLERSFKPYYKWITFNTFDTLNGVLADLSFKPYYKWITFNTKRND